MNGYTGTVEEQTLTTPHSTLLVHDVEGFKAGDYVDLLWETTRVNGRVTLAETVAIPAGTTSGLTLAGGVDTGSETAAVLIPNNLYAGVKATAFISFLPYALTPGDSATIFLPGESFTSSVQPSDTTYADLAGRLTVMINAAPATGVYAVQTDRTIDLYAIEPGVLGNSIPWDLDLSPGGTIDAYTTFQNIGSTTLVGGIDPDLISVTLNTTETFYSSPSAARTTADHIATHLASQMNLSLPGLIAQTTGPLLSMTAVSATGNFYQVDTVSGAFSIVQTSFDPAPAAIPAVGTLTLSPTLVNFKLRIGLVDYKGVRQISDASIDSPIARMVTLINATPSAPVIAAAGGLGEMTLTAKVPGVAGNLINFSISSTIGHLTLLLASTYDTLVVPANVPVSLKSETRELVTYVLNGIYLSFSERTIFRYPYLPEKWTGISYSGVLLEPTKSFTKTFSNNITTSWDPVLQDVVIEEQFADMDYNFFHTLWELYASNQHLLYRPRDLQFQEYEVEIADIKPGKQHQYWVESVTVKYKIHKVTCAGPADNNRYIPGIRHQIFPADDIQI